MMQKNPPFVKYLLKIHTHSSLPEKYSCILSSLKISFKINKNIENQKIEFSESFFKVFKAMRLENRTVYP